MNIPDAAHCSGCGEELGLEPVGVLGELKCPRCLKPLEDFADGKGVLHDCAACGGQFVEHALLRDLLVRHELPMSDLVPAPSSRRPRITEENVRYLPCPACGALMNRKNFGEISGVIVDVCRDHGTWFDTGELPRVLAFVSSGGLERERRRKAEQALEQERAATSRATLEAGVVPHDAPASSGNGFIDQVIRILLG